MNTSRFKDAQVAYAVSNAPYSLIEKLRIDSAVLRFAAQTSADEIFKELTSCVKHAPKHLQDFTLPYVYLVALFVKGETTRLKAARALDSKNFKWFKLVADALVMEIVPTTTYSLAGKLNFLKPPSTNSGANNDELRSLHWSIKK